MRDSCSRFGNLTRGNMNWRSEFGATRVLITATNGVLEAAVLV